MPKLEITKRVVSALVGVSTSFTVANVIRNNVSSDSKIQQAEIWIGSVACGVVAAEATEKATSKFIDDIATAYQQAKNGN